MNIQKYKEFRLDEAFNSDPYPYELEAKSTSMDRWYVIMTPEGNYRMWFEVQKSLGPKVMRIVLGQAAPNQKVFKKIMQSFKDPMKVMSTMFTILWEALEKDQYVRQQDGLALALPKSIGDRYDSLVKRSLQRALNGTQFVIPQDEVTFTNSEFEYRPIVKRGKSASDVFVGKDVAVAPTAPTASTDTAGGGLDDLKATLISVAKGNSVMAIPALTQSSLGKELVRKVTLLKTGKDEVVNQEVEFFHEGKSVLKYADVVRHAGSKIELPFYRRFNQVLTVFGERGSYPETSRQAGTWVSMKGFLELDNSLGGSNWENIAVPGMEAFVTLGSFDGKVINSPYVIPWYQTSLGRGSIADVFGNDAFPTKGKLIAFLKKYGKELAWKNDGGVVVGTSVDGAVNVGFTLKTATVYKVDNRIRDPKGTKYVIYAMNFYSKIGKAVSSSYKTVDLFKATGEDKYGEYDQATVKIMDELTALGIPGSSKFTFFGT